MFVLLYTFVLLYMFVLLILLYTFCFGGNLHKPATFLHYHVLLFLLKKIIPHSLIKTSISLSVAGLVPKQADEMAQEARR